MRRYTPLRSEDQRLRETHRVERAEDDLGDLRRVAGARSFRSVGHRRIDEVTFRCSRGSAQAATGAEVVGRQIRPDSSSRERRSDPAALESDGREFARTGKGGENDVGTRHSLCHSRCGWCALVRQGGGAGRFDVVHTGREACADHVGRHRLAHPSQADEGHLRGGCRCHDGQPRGESAVPCEVDWTNVQ